MRIAIWHNIMWARYKAQVFSALYRESQIREIDVSIYQIAETDNNRVGLSPVDKNWHTYPYTLLFAGAYSQVPKLLLFGKMVRLTYASTADVTVLSGYEKPEVWLQALILTLKRQKFAFFCDSTLFDQPQTFLKGIAKRIFFKWADGAFCYGTRATEYLRYYGVQAERIHIRRQAAALSKNYTPAAALQQRIENAPPTSAPRYLYVGRLSEEKSLDRLLQAFHQVRAHYQTATLVLIGKGPALEALRDLSIELDLTDSVEFAGAKFDEDLFFEYSKATCLVLPSKSEPWGLVVNEALSYGCPVVVSHRCGCVPELVRDGKTGYVFSWDNLADLIEKMKAAPATFSDVVNVSKECLNQIAPFDPFTSAEGLIVGCLVIAKRPVEKTKVD